MGESVGWYLDEKGNTVREDDLVVYKGDTYKVRYISHEYVNLQGVSDLAWRWFHLHFSVGVPERLVSNATKKKDDDMKLWKDMTPEEKGALLLAYHEGKVIEFIQPEDGFGWWESVKGDGTSLSWCDNTAYCVKPEPKKPREFWLWCDGQGKVLHKFSTPIKPEDVYFSAGDEIIHVREVLE